MERNEGKKTTPYKVYLDENLDRDFVRICKDREKSGSEMFRRITKLFCRGYATRFFQRFPREKFSNPAKRIKVTFEVDFLTYVVINHIATSKHLTFDRYAENIFDIHVFGNVESLDEAEAQSEKDLGDYELLEGLFRD